MSWLSSSTSRQSLPAASSHHQTLLGKALYEHGDCQRVAAVALSSSSIQNSSLGPNLLALVRVDVNTLPLFTSAFSSDTSDTSLQFTKKLVMYSQERNCVVRFGNFTASLLETKYFQKSLQEMEIEVGNDSQPLSSFWKFLLASSSPIFTSLKKLKIEFCLSDELLRNLAKMFPVLEELQCQNNSTECLKGIEKLTKLTLLDLSHCRQITDDDVCDIASSLINLNSLNLTYCFNITDDSVRVIAAKLVNLTSLDLGFCNITDAGIEALATSCTNLTSLNFDNCDKITNVTLQAISKLVNLSELDLTCCNNITDEGIEALVVGCVNLTSLNLAYCNNITNVGIHAIATNCASLTSLNLHIYEKITDAGVDSFAKLVNLTSLDLTSCRISDVGIQAIAASCANLTVLNLSNCSPITDVGLQSIAVNCVNLTSLNLNGCDKITDVGVQAIAASCVNLTSLQLFCRDVTRTGKANAKKALPNLRIF